MNRQTKAILKTILDDIKNNHHSENTELIATLKNHVVTDLLLAAGCPQTILDAINETVYLSSIERRFCCMEIQDAIKKIPADKQGF